MSIFRFYKWKITLTSSLLDGKWGRDDIHEVQFWITFLQSLYLSGTLLCALFMVCCLCKLPGAETVNCGTTHRNYWLIHKNHRLKNMQYPVKRNKTDWTSHLLCASSPLSGSRVTSKSIEGNLATLPGLQFVLTFSTPGHILCCEIFCSDIVLT